MRQNEQKQGSENIKNIKTLKMQRLHIQNLYIKSAISCVLYKIPQKKKKKKLMMTIKWG